MILCVETNFILELAFARNEHETCEQILSLAEKQTIEVAIPAYSLGEVYEAWTRRARQRRELCEQLDRELRELARSKPYRQSSSEMQLVSQLLARSTDEERQAIDEAANKILRLAVVIPTTRDVLNAAMQLQTSRELSPQDSIVYASVLYHLEHSLKQSRCFVTKNSKDFISPNIESDLVARNCKLLTRFENALGFINANQPKP